MIKTVSAYEARTNLGELINLAYYKGVEVVIERMGKPMVKIVKINRDKLEDKEKANEAILRFGGIWKSRDGDSIEKNARAFRKEFKLTSL